VKATLSGAKLQVEGPKGKLSTQIDERIGTKIEDGKIVFSIVQDRPESNALHGLIRSQVANMVEGVAKGFTKELEINGVGFRANLKGRDLELSLGFSHPVVYKIPEGINITVDKQVKLAITGADFQLVGQTAAEIRALRKPEPYKGKGIKYATETIRRKAGKAAASATGSGA
jgi:large subunit ribosomal protein L6